MIGLYVFGVRGREWQHEFAARVVGSAFAGGLNQFLKCPFFPAARSSNHFGFQRFDIHFLPGCRRSAHQHVNARKDGLGKLHIKFNAGTCKGALQYRLQFDPRFGVVILARQINQAGIKTRVNIAPYEESRARALA